MACAALPQTDIQTYRHTDIQTDKQTDRPTYLQNRRFWQVIKGLKCEMYENAAFLCFFTFQAAGSKNGRFSARDGDKNVAARGMLEGGAGLRPPFDANFCDFDPQIVLSGAF